MKIHHLDVRHASLQEAILTELVQPAEILDGLADDADGRVIECAVAGHGEVMVGGDRAMVQDKLFQGLSLVTLREDLTWGGLCPP